MVRDGQSEKSLLGILNALQMVSGGLNGFVERKLAWKEGIR